MDRPGNKQPASVYIAHAHEDESLARRLISHLAPLQIQGLITASPLTSTVPAGDWPASLNQLKEAQVALFLLSPAALESGFFKQDIELATARDAARETAV